MDTERPDSTARAPGHSGPGAAATEEPRLDVEGVHAAVFDAVHDAIFVHDLDGRLLDLNEAACRLYGVSCEEGRRMRVVPDFSGPGNPVDRLPELWARVVAGETQRLEWNARRPSDGSCFPVEVWLKRVTIRGRDLVVADIRDLQAEQALRGRNASYETAEQQARLGSWDLGSTQVAGFWSAQMFRLFGYDSSRPAPTWEEFLERVHRADRELLLGAYREARESGVASETEFRWVRDEPEPVAEQVFSANLTGVRDADGRVLHVACVFQDITRQRRAEEELRARSAETERLLETMASMFVVWGVITDPSDRVVDLRFDYFNAAYSQSTGLRLADVQGRTVREVWPETEESWYEVYDEVRRTGAPKSFEMSHLPTAGTYACKAYRPRDDGSQVCCVFEDVTEQRRAEVQIRAANRQLRMLSDVNQALVRARDEQSLLGSVCTVAAESGGYELAWVGFAEGDAEKTVRVVARAGSAREYLDRVVVGWSDLAQGRGPVGMAIRTGQVCLVRDTSVDPTFAPWRAAALRSGLLSVCAVPLLQDGSAFGAIAFYSREVDAFDAAEIGILRELADDLSFGVFILRSRVDHLRAEKNLRASEDRFRHLFEGAADPIFLHDDEGRIVAVNQAACRGLGYTSDELLGLTVGEVDVANDLDQQGAIWKRVLEGETVSLETIHRRSDGSTFPVDLRLTPFDDGDRPLVFAAARDISQRRWAEQEHARLEETLRHAQKMESIGRLAGGVAHDFNNLLTAIGINVELGLLDVEPSHPLHARLVEVDKAVESAARLTRQLLAFSRQQMIAPKVLDLNRVVRSVEAMLRRLLGEDIALRVRLGEGLGSVRIDPGQAEQILLNLAVNARDAMPGGGTLTIETSEVAVDGRSAHAHPGMAAGRYVQLALADDGSGMSDEVKARLFEPFFTTKELGRGTGLGLAMVYGALEQNGGRIEVESELGRGTTFRIYLPRLDAPEETLGTSSAARDSGGSETIVLVEDEQSVRILATEILTQLGYTVRAYATGEEALAGEAGAQPIDLLLTDVVLPGINGRVLAEQLGSLHPGARVLFSSGYTPDQIVQHGVLEKGMHFIAKPYRAEALARKVREVIDRRG